MLQESISSHNLPRISPSGSCDDAHILRPYLNEQQSQHFHHHHQQQQQQHSRHQQHQSLDMSSPTKNYHPHPTSQSRKRVSPDTPQRHQYMQSHQQHQGAIGSPGSVISGSGIRTPNIEYGPSGNLLPSINSFNLYFP